MSRRKTERLLSLVVCLLSSQRYLTATQIRAAVPGYPDSFDAFKRMFERDKEELRELGIPLDMGTNGPLDDELGYRIPRQEDVLPDIRLEPDATCQPGIEPRLTGEALFGTLWEAVRDRRPVTFTYRALGRSDLQQRRLEPWGVVNRHGRWYVAGHDQARDAVRVFRLSRIEGRVEFSGPRVALTVPEGTDVRELVREWDSHPAEQQTAVLKIRAGTGFGLRRRAAREQPGGDGWDLVDVPFSDAGWFAEHIASFGADVVVSEPADLRDAVITRLKGVLA